jgi:hypothetical protein
MLANAVLVYVVGCVTWSLFRNEDDLGQAHFSGRDGDLITVGLAGILVALVLRERREP